MPKKFLVYLAILLLISLFSQAQLSENFNDGNFIENPSWIGDTPSFVINNSFQLQSNNSIANSSFALVTENKLCTATQWEYWMKLAFNPSSANYVDTYLTSSAPNPADSTNVGYFVRAGNTDDEISLYRRDPNGITIKIIDGENGTLDHTSNIFKIKVTRDSTGKWNLLRDLTGTGNSYTKEGTVTDSTYTRTSWFGFLIKQSTASFFQKHFIDDIEIKRFDPDFSPPEIVSATAISSSKVDVFFNEPLESSTNIFSNYSANKGLGMPDSIIIDAQNSSLVHLVFANSFTNGYNYTLTVNGVKDLSGNAINNATISFSFYKPQQYDVVIDEIFADPSPEVGLPGYEWIELKNTSAFPINLKGWKVSDVSSSSTAFKEFTLKPDSFVIVCSTSAFPSLSVFGKTISATNFPLLNNDGDLISLQDETGKIIHAVQYSSDWYQNELKKDGGWSLEMIDTKNPCAVFSNWTSSKDNNGGTPGRKNSVDGINNDEAAPKLLHALINNSTSISLLFNEPVDSAQAALITNFAFDNSLSATSVKLVPPLFDKVTISLNNPITAGNIYNVTATNISDCAGNVISSNNSAKFGLPQDADSFDIVINEILFNPLPSGVDYVELYNRSNKIIDLSKLYIANRNSNNVISSIDQLTTENILFFPNNFMVITTDPLIVKSQYITPDPDAFLKINSLPSFPNDKGNVIILNDQKNIIDEVAYADNWHFSLIHNTEGVSLERMDYNAPSAQSNFHSAATSVGYGTPGYKNSQYKLTEEFRGDITVTPAIFSPDNDGNEDFAIINYKFPSPGYVANITIFDASGRPVRYLEKNSLSGTSGYYRWDGLDDKRRKLPQGIYIIYIEIFNKEGKKKQFKNTIVLARKNY
ncbi:MAG: lamin tail domain-containing protein [Bacteroidota bacterium]|nr:lamin tail domain-containing protein [Bacteroidota bacterium]